MHEAVVSLISRDRPVELPVWRSFWDRLHAGGMLRGEAAALLASLSTRMPGRDTLHGLLESLDERRSPRPADAFAAAVNIVGAGGGPATFNISTAAAFVAAAMGVPVVKTGSRAYTSRFGSIDLLERLGITPTTSYEHTQEVMERCGIAFAGFFVYPQEVTLLARAVAPLEIRQLGSFVNTLGPFLADMPVRAQVTGVSRPRHVEGLRHAAEYVSHATGRSVWLAVNDAGADELLGFTANQVRAYEDGVESEFALTPGELGLGSGRLADLAVPEGGVDRAAELFLDVLAGRCSPTVRETVCLNAAALAVAGRLTGDWHEALAAADAALRDGSALSRVERLRSPEAAHA
ncbi:anthranilate phosphoribosyltransferase [Kitasatospora sp. NPDC017646]|uniref:anthranilate phosphoribosyltransferase n=1 Tax=Kitasatospora sp. NPDC017646 TaxID=3364024 RepID=UPI0037A2712F